jgi:hypothetical protein
VTAFALKNQGRMLLGKGVPRVSICCAPQGAMNLRDGLRLGEIPAH